MEAGNLFDVAITIAAPEIGPGEGPLLMNQVIMWYNEISGWLMAVCRNN
jgi:hypothetical protein